MFLCDSVSVFTLKQATWLYVSSLQVMMGHQIKTLGFLYCLKSLDVQSIQGFGILNEELYILLGKAVKKNHLQHEYLGLYFIVYFFSVLYYTYVETCVNVHVSVFGHKFDIIVGSLYALHNIFQNFPDVYRLKIYILASCSLQHLPWVKLLDREPHSSSKDLGGPGLWLPGPGLEISRAGI